MYSFNTSYTNYAPKTNRPFAGTDTNHNNANKEFETKIESG